MKDVCHRRPKMLEIVFDIAMMCVLGGFKDDVTTLHKNS